MRMLFRSVLPLSIVSIFFACSSSKDEAPQQQSDGTITLAGNVSVMQAASVDDVAVLPGKLLFPKATHADVASKQAGDILVGEAGTSAATPNKWGFLRKVVSVSDDGTNIVVTTEQANLTDVVQEGEFQATLDVPSLSPDDPSAVTKTLSKKGGGPIKLLDFSGKTLFASSGSVEVDAGKTIGYDANVTLKTGTLDFTPTFDVGAKLKPGLSLKGLIKEAHAIATGQLDAVAEIDASFKLTGDATGPDVAALIAKKVFKSSTTTIAEHDIKLPSIKLGFISIPAHAHFKADVVCDFKWGGETRVDVGGKASVKVSAGAKYDGSSITPVWEHSQSFEQIGPTWTLTNDVAVKCSIVPQFSLNLWDVASGEVTAEAYASLSARATCNASTLTGDVSGEAYAGASAKAHAKLDVFGLYKWEKECTLFDLHSPKASFMGSFPLGKGASCTPSDPPAMPEVTDPPPSCFGGTDTPGDDAGTVDTGTPGDDVGSDAASDGAADGAVMCGHDTCTVGDVLTTGCDKDGEGGKCIEAICLNDSYCCEHAWTLSCVAHITNGDYGCAKKTCP
ncbi:MAG: hypothetical protein ACXVEE_23060 [Polyangiales bacterium]